MISIKSDRTPILVKPEYPVVTIRGSKSTTFILNSSEPEVLVNSPSPNISIIEKGPQGIPGPKGDPGEPGLTNYEIALRNGFIGTELDWLNSLKAELKISNETDNRLENKSDGLYVKDSLNPDPLAFYLLSKG